VGLRDDKVKMVGTTTSLLPTGVCGFGGVEELI
jgi:hypothetical protein